MAEVKQLLTDPAEIEHFFAGHPEDYLSFLSGSVSQTFRGKEADAKIRIDALKAKAGEVVRKQNEQTRNIQASDISDETKESLLATVHSTAAEAIRKLEEAIAQEEEFAGRLNAFIAEVLQMEDAIGREVSRQNVYRGVENFKAAMEAIDETVWRAEEQRIQSLIDLAEYWKRLREMGDEVIYLQEAHQEISRALLESPS